MILQTNHNLIKQLSRSTGELFDFFFIFFFFLPSLIEMILSSLFFLLIQLSLFVLFFKWSSKYHICAACNKKQVFTSIRWADTDIHLPLGDSRISYLILGNQERKKTHHSSWSKFSYASLKSGHLLSNSFLRKEVFILFNSLIPRALSAAFSHFRGVSHALRIAGLTDRRKYCVNTLSSHWRVFLQNHPRKRC